MTKMAKRISLALIVLIAVILSMPMSALAYSNSVRLMPSYQSKYSSYDYVIDSFKVDIVVNDNNSYDITENITVYFKEPKHGIFRTLPLKNQIKRLDGTTSSNSARISNLYVSDEYETKQIEGNYFIQIGDENKTITGKKNYVIKYRYSIGLDPLKDNDELYYNIIGTGWEVPIGNVSFTITMPKEFDQSKLGFSAGYYGVVSNNSKLINYTVNGNVIEGYYDEILTPREGITVRCELPEDYFSGYTILDYLLCASFVAVPVMLLIIIMLLYFIFGRSEKAVETVEFYPPNGINSLEAGFDYYGKCTDEQVVSLVLYLANKGYIKITDGAEFQALSQKADFALYKLKDYEGSNLYEKLFLDNLFSHSNVVTSESLKNNFYVTVNQIKSGMSKKENCSQIVKRSSTICKNVSILLVALSVLLTSLNITRDYYAYYGWEFQLIIPIITLIISFMLASILTGKGIADKKFQYQILGGASRQARAPKFVNEIVIIELLSLLLVLVLQFFNTELDTFKTISLVIGYFCSLVSACLTLLFDKRTPYGIEMLGKISGFRNFLITAEKDKLEALVEEDPTYFYDILPYTYSLDVSDKWVKKFDSIALQPPTWYSSTRPFTAATLGSFVNHTMSSMNNSMTSIPQQTTSGGHHFSGGGFSGGGSGGGGGAW